MGVCGSPRLTRADTAEALRACEMTFYGATGQRESEPQRRLVCVCKARFLGSWAAQSLAAEGDRGPVVSGNQSRPAELPRDDVHRQPVAVPGLERFNAATRDMVFWDEIERGGDREGPAGSARRALRAVASSSSTDHRHHLTRRSDDHVRTGDIRADGRY
jgi:hypothetical protein